jgi:hypothetical protein
LYGYETLSLVLREEHRLRVSENRMLRKIYEQKRYETIGGWRKMRIEELRNLHSSPNIVRIIEPRRMGWEGHAAHMGEKRNAYCVLAGEPEG